MAGLWLQLAQHFLAILEKILRGRGHQEKLPCDVVKWNRRLPILSHSEGSTQGDANEGSSGPREAGYANSPAVWFFLGEENSPSRSRMGGTWPCWLPDHPPGLHVSDEQMSRPLEWVP